MAIYQWWKCGYKNMYMFMWGDEDLKDTLVTDVLAVLNELMRKYGNAFRIHIGHSPYIILSHPKYAEVSSLVLYIYQLIPSVSTPIQFFIPIATHWGLIFKK